MYNGGYYDRSIKPRRKLAGGFLTAGNIRLINAIILQAATLKFLKGG
jgi:hypothetical protein